MRAVFERRIKPVGAADYERRRWRLARPRGHARRELARGELLAALVEHDGERLPRNVRADAISLGGEHHFDAAISGAFFGLDFGELEGPVGGKTLRVLLHAVGHPRGLVGPERDDLKFHGVRA